MLALSRELNPECEHLPGDMRTLRLGRSFDAVLVHDAIMYMTTREDLLAAARTAYEHTRPGGAAIFQPDCIRETFRERTELEGSDDGATMRSVHDRHVEGLFSRAAWIETLGRAGYEVEAIPTTPSRS